MTAFYDHGMQGGILYSLPPALIGASWEIILAFYIIGFFDGSRADWLGDYNKNHGYTESGWNPRPTRVSDYTPANFIHVWIVDPFWHIFGANWWDKVGFGLKFIAASATILEIGITILEFWHG